MSVNAPFIVIGTSIISAACAADDRLRALRGIGILKLLKQRAAEDDGMPVASVRHGPYDWRASLALRRDKRAHRRSAHQRHVDERHERSRGARDVDRA